MCSIFNGQCECEPNVEGRQCDRCVEGSYGAPPDGCTVRPQTNPWMYKCRSHFHQRMPAVLPLSCTWNGYLQLYYRRMHVSCNFNCWMFVCSYLLHLYVQSCLPGVTGNNCSECESQQHFLQAGGCHPCQCSSEGSASLQCNDTGVCLCKVSLLVSRVHQVGFSSSIHPCWYV